MHRWPPRFGALSFACLLLCSCATHFTNAEQISVKLAQQVQGNKLIVNASVTNESPRTITMVRHPDHYTISVSPDDRSRGELTRANLVSWNPAQRSDLVRLKPNQSANFTNTITLAWDQKGRLTLDSIMMKWLVWDDTLRSSFTYGAYPDHLPFGIRFFRPNLVMTSLNASTTFPAPSRP